MPTRAARQPPTYGRADWLAIAVLYVVAFAARFPIWQSLPYGDEGMFFHVARNFWNKPPNLDDLYDDPVHPHMSFLFFHRPFFHVFLGPSAALGFDAYRLFHMAITSLLPVLAVLILRDVGVRRGFAYGAGLVVATHPYLFSWNALLWPDSLMTVFLGASIWFAGRQQAAPAALAALAAVWTKETAFAMLVFLLAWKTWEGVRDGRTRLWPLKADRVQTAYFAAAAVAPFPLMYAMGTGLGLPGGPAQYDYPLRLLDQFFLFPWLGAFVLIGLLWRRSRFLALAGLVYPVTLLALHVVLDRAVEGWYLVPAQFFGLVAVAMGLDEWTRRVAPRRGAVRCAPAYASLALALLLLVSIAAPAAAWKTTVLHPWTQKSDGNVFETWSYERNRDGDMRSLLEFLHERDVDTLVAFDIYMPHVLYPVSYEARQTYHWDTRLTEAWRQPIQPWAHNIETRGDLSVGEKLPTALNDAIQAVYADCIVHDEGRFYAIEGKRCAGSGERLEEEFQRRKPA